MLERHPRSCSSTRISFHLRVVVAIILCFGWLLSNCHAQLAEGVSLEVVTDGLASPVALAVRPGGSRSGPDLFLAESASGRVLGLSTRASKPTLVEAVVGMPSGPQQGPCALAFRTRNHLLVGLNGSDGKSLSVRDYDLDDDRLPMPNDEYQLLLTYATNEPPVALASIVRDQTRLYVATGEHHWLLEGKLGRGPTEELLPFVDTLEATKIGVPRAITASEKGYLVVAQAGQTDTAEASQLVFYHPIDKTAGPLLQVPTALDKIVSLAYSAQSGNLYAANRSDANTQQDGVYRLDAGVDSATGKQVCQAVLIAKTARPVALVFAPKGDLYVATQGDSASAGPSDAAVENVTGKLLKLSGDL